MKHKALFLAALLLILTACGASEADAPSPTPDLLLQSDKAEAADAYISVLQDNTPFTSSDTGQELTLDQLSMAISADGSADVKIAAFTVANVDSDSIPEVLLWLIVDSNHAYGYEILRWQDGGITGYTVPYTSFVDFKADGTFSFFEDVNDRGYGSMTFTGSSWSVDKISYCKSAPGGSGVTYFADGAPATEEAFLTAVNDQSGKTRVAWYDYTNYNIGEQLQDTFR